jgi:hypothetical protein
LKSSFRNFIPTLQPCLNMLLSILALECKENPEHGLWLILTFEPTISFLVPLDRCIYLAIATVMQNSSGVDAFYRRHALKAPACLLVISSESEGKYCR